MPASPRSLLIYKPDGTTQVTELVKPLIKIGRGEENDVILEDRMRTISRFHAQISFENGPPVLEDLKSSNGTYLNDQPLVEPGPLHPDDVIRIGKYLMIYRDPAAAEQAQSEASSPFQIQSASVELNELQERATLLGLAQDKALAEKALAETSIGLRALELLHEVGVRLARTVTVTDVVETAVDLLFKIEGVQRATLIPWNEADSAFAAGEVYTRQGPQTEQGGPPATYDPRNLVLSKTILHKVRADNRPLLIHDARSHAGFTESASIVRAGIQAALCSPLTFQGRFLGILYADNLAQPDAFSQGNFRTFTTIAAQTGLALATAITRAELLKQQVEQAAMRLYLPPQVADIISATDGSIELGGVLQPVTVLFADIRGFTSLSERLDAREVVLLLNEFFTAMTDVVFEARGTLDKYIGDCVMALFGAPVPGEDDPERGLRAALKMQEEVKRLNAERRSKGLQEIQIGVGLHTGAAVVGNIGSAQRMQYTAIGDTVNVASRVMSNAAPGHVVVSEDFRAALGDKATFAHLGEVELKGRQRRMNLYSVSAK